MYGVYGSQAFLAVVAQRFSDLLNFYCSNQFSLDAYTGNSTNKIAAAKGDVRLKY